MNKYNLVITAHPTAQPTMEEIADAIQEVIRKKVADSDDAVLKAASGFRVEIMPSNS